MICNIGHSYSNIDGLEQGAEEKVKKGYASPNNLEEANKLVNDCKVKMTKTVKSFLKLDTVKNWVEVVKMEYFFI